MRWRVRWPGADFVRFVMRRVYDSPRHRTPAACVASGGAARRAARAAARRLPGGGCRLHAAGQLPALADRKSDDLDGFDTRRRECGAMGIPDDARRTAGGLGEVGLGNGAEELVDVVDHLKLRAGWRLTKADSIPIAPRALTLGSERREPAGDGLALALLRHAAARGLEILGGMARVPRGREDDRDGGLSEHPL